MMDLKVQVIFRFLVMLVMITGSVCPLSFCPLVTCPEQDCRGGKVLGQYGCCYVCAKQQGELCGGLYGLIGTCDQGLRCVLPPQEVNETITIIHHVGVCQVKPTESTDTTTIQGNVHVDTATTTTTTTTTTAAAAAEAQGNQAKADKTTPRNNEPPGQQAEAMAKPNPSAAPGGDLISNTTLRSNTSTVPHDSSLNNISTTQDPKLQNGVSTFLRTKGLNVLLCLFVFHLFAIEVI